MPSAPPRVLSGIQPTGAGFQLGNYLGAVRNWVAMQDEFDAFYFLPDLHAITVPHDPAELRRRTAESAAELLALGLDPARCTLFVQSHVPEHAELGWVLSCLTGFGEASRMTQFKDKSARSELGSATVGLFNYPILQAADILLYQADQVPVGDDQRQHLELTRDLAQRFNSRFGPTFTVPAAYIPKQTARIADLQDPAKKMSKSLPPAGTVYLRDDPSVIVKKVRSAVTDTGREVRAADGKPGITNLLSILAAVTDRPVAELETAYDGKGYGDFKRDVADALVAFVEPFQARYAEQMADPARLADLLADGAAKAGAVAAATMAEVRDRVGFLPRRAAGPGH
ncbi:MAG: tryptophan--tRNA ligase [Actinomycetota bacterium]|nr:tryptophan--tRNA ligase [Actinomycetota bacterium]